MSQHRRLLKQAGLVIGESHGTRRIYRLRDDGIEAIRQYFADTRDNALARFASSPRTRAPRAGGVGSDLLVIEFAVAVWGSLTAALASAAAGA